MNALHDWLSQLQYEKLLDVLIVVAASLLCITVHETCHGYVAYRLGDPTAKNAGRLTLNPLKHIDLVGLLMMAVAHFGWAKAVPVNPGYFKHYKRDMAITAAAGPVSNVVLAALALFLYSIAYWGYWTLNQPEWMSYVLYFLQYVAVLSAGLAVFNLFPIPPLDGSKILFAFLPSRAYQWVLRYERFGFVLLLVAVWTGLLDTPLYFLRNGLLDGLERICYWPFDVLNTLAG